MCIFPSVRVFKYYVRVSSVEDGEARKVLTAATELRSQLVPGLTHSGYEHLSVPVCSSSASSHVLSLLLLTVKDDIQGDCSDSSLSTSCCI